MTEAATLEPSRRLKWNEIAAKISQLSNAKTRKGKQCRERYLLCETDGSISYTLRSSGRQNGQQKKREHYFGSRES